MQPFFQGYMLIQNNLFVLRECKPSLLLPIFEFDIGSLSARSPSVGAIDHHEELEQVHQRYQCNQLCNPHQLVLYAES